MVGVFWPGTNFTVANLLDVYDQVEEMMTEEAEMSEIIQKTRNIMKQVGVSIPLVYFVALPLVFSILAIILCVPICCPVCCCTPGVRFRHLQKKIDKKATKYLRSKGIRRPNRGMSPYEQAVQCPRTPEFEKIEKLQQKLEHRIEKGGCCTRPSACAGFGCLSYGCWFAFAIVYIVALILFFVAQGKTNNIISLDGLKETRGTMDHTVDQIGAAADASLSSLTGQKIEFFSAFLDKDIDDDTLYRKYNATKDLLKNVATFDALIDGIKNLVYKNGDYSLQKVLHSALYPSTSTKDKHENYVDWKRAADFFVNHI